MKITDLVKLGIAGVKPQDIKEIATLGINADDVVALVGAGYKMKDIKELVDVAEPDEQPEEKADETASETPTRAEADVQRIAELEKQLADLQKDNANRDYSDNIETIDPIAALTDLFREE